mgnify:CR=1 FL=1
MTPLALFPEVIAPSSSLPPMRGAASFSPCERYRYTLTRTWAAGPALLICMLNPSTATASVLDPTVRRCVGFAQRERFAGLEVVNLFALRATDPRELARATDPVGPGNDAAIREAAARAGRIVAAWGDSLPAALRGRADAALAILARPGDVHRIGSTTRRGSPKHPLYLAAATPLELHRGRPP